MSKQQKGLVMESGPERLTVLTPHGEFLSIPWQKATYPEIGAEITFASPSIGRASSRLVKNLRIIAVAACVLLVLFSAVYHQGLLWPTSKIVAYVNVDINPSIELGLNKYDIVISALGLNQDGEHLLAKLDLLELEIDKAVTLITLAAVEEKYLKAGEENNVLITVSDVKRVPEKVQSIEKKVTEQLSAQKIEANTKVIEVNKEIHNNAKELGVSPGKYVILMEAVEEGLDVSLEDIKGSSITKAIKEAGGIPGEVISRAQKQKNQYKELEKQFKELTKQKEVKNNKENFADRDDNSKDRDNRRTELEDNQERRKREDQNSSIDKNNSKDKDKGKDKNKDKDNRKGNDKWDNEDRNDEKNDNNGRDKDKGKDEKERDKSADRRQTKDNSNNRD